MEFIPKHYISIYFLIGLLVVMAYAWQQFNRPTFSGDKSMPSTVDPLRYMFTQRTYRRARLTYVVLSLLLYIACVWPGPQMAKVFGPTNDANLQAEAWALVAALLLVGLVPNSKITWLVMIEEFVRRCVHQCYLVPSRVDETIGSLDDNPYEPPKFLVDALRDRLDVVRSDLDAPMPSLKYRWARATFIFQLLSQIGEAKGHPLKKAAFAPFDVDFERIQDKFKTIQNDIAVLDGNPSHGSQAEITLKASINSLLRRMYAYILWGLGTQAKNEREIDELL